MSFKLLFQLKLILLIKNQHTRYKMTEQSLELFNPDLFSSVRRNVNLLKEKQVAHRKSALQELHKIITTQELSGLIFAQIAQLSLKQVLKALSDHSQACRQLATNILIQILPRSDKIGPLLPYIMSVLVDRTNCHDLQGIANLPQKMRPPPGQKPKVLIKVVESCEEIRVLYCGLIKKIVILLQHEGDEIRKHLDDLINVTRALIMDAAPQVQKAACETLEMTCKLYKDLLLHYTQIMGRAVLLPLISKKSKVRIAGLRTLNSILWCGLYKYNAFVFQNLIGFRDPNSVPIKDFYEPSHNINYLATFITDPNNKVRIEFMKSIKLWICDLNDKYDHHGKLVPYLMSGLFDVDDEVKQTALAAIEEIGRQIESEREKDFRESKQFAIDAKWTWDGKLVHLPVPQPLTKRPSLGSRFFIRGHVRKFWNALYRQIKDIKLQNRVRACNLAVYGAVFTQNYLTQYLDDMIPHLLTAVVCHQKQEQYCCEKIQQMFYFIGRYCEVSSYLHIMKSALEGKLVQNEEFIKAALLGLTKMIQGSLQAIPENQGLCHKKKQIVELLTMISDSGAIEEIYNYNCKEIQAFVQVLVRGLRAKGKQEEINQVFSEHFVLIVKLWSVGFYEQKYVSCMKLQPYQQQKPVQGTNLDAIMGESKQNLNPEHRNPNNQLVEFMDSFSQLYSQNFISALQEYLSDLYQNPPSLMDSDFKLIIVLGNYLIKSSYQQADVLFSLAKEIISESLSLNRSVEILNFCFKYISWLWDEHQLYSKKNQQTFNLTNSNYKQLAEVLQRCMANLNKFKPQKKLPIYDQHLLQQNQKQQPQNVMKINQDTFLILFKNACQAFRKFYLQKNPLTNSVLGQIFDSYIDLGQKIRRNSQGNLESIKTLWAVFEREDINEDFPKRILFKNQTKTQVKILPKLIDFVIENIETLGEPQHKKVSMLFSILNRVLKCVPVFQNAATPLPLIYPQYNPLFEKLIKYAMDQKDVELKQKYVEFLKNAAKRMKPWFELQYKMASEGEKFIKAQFLKDILYI